MPPSNDDFANAITISGSSGSTTPVTIDDATTEPFEPIGSNVNNGINQSIWYSWTAPADGNYEFDTYGSPAADGNGDLDPDVGSFGNIDSTLAIWTGTNFGDLVEEASNDDAGFPNNSGHTPGFWSEVTIAAISGTVYWIQIGTYDIGYTGNMLLNWTPVIPTITYFIDSLLHDTKITHSIDVLTFQQSYTLTQNNYTLNTLPGLNGLASGVNNTGTVVGTIGVHATKWDSNSLSLIAFLSELPDGIDSYASHIANNGVIVGISSFQNSYPPHNAVYWTDSSTVINLASTLFDSFTTDISNGSGRIVGFYQQTISPFRRLPAYWNPGLNTIGTDIGTIEAVNSSDEMAGYLLIDNDNFPAYWSPNGTQTLLERGGHTAVRASDINDIGDIVGWSQGGENATAFLWMHNDYSNPIIFPGIPGPVALTINNNGDIGGSSGNQLATVWLNYDTNNPIILPYIAPDEGFGSGLVLDIRDDATAVGKVWDGDYFHAAIWTLNTESDPAAQISNRIPLPNKFHRVNWL